LRFRDCAIEINYPASAPVTRQRFRSVNDHGQHWLSYSADHLRIQWKDALMVKKLAFLLSAGLITICIAIPTSVAASTSSASTSGVCRAKSLDGSCPKTNGYRDRHIYYSDGYNTFVNVGGNGLVCDTSADTDPPFCHGNTLTVRNPGDWSITTNDGNSNRNDGTNGWVKQFPDTQQNFITGNNVGQRISSFKSLTTTFKISDPYVKGDIYEALEDIWLASPTSSNAQTTWDELMIWINDRRNVNPPGVKIATFIYAHQRFSVWSDVTKYVGRANGGGYTFTLLLDGHETSGQIRDLGLLQWLVKHKYITAANQNTGIAEINFGWEVCSTNGKPDTFTMKSYSISAVK
jgi:hypothetical protein